MKTAIKKFLDSGFAFMLIGLLCAVFGVTDASAMTADPTTIVPEFVTNPEQGGAVGQGSHDLSNVSETLTREEADKLILDYVNTDVIKARPWLFPLVAISQEGNKKGLSSRIGYDFAMGTLGMSTTLTTAVADGTLSQTALVVADPDILAMDQTIVVDGVYGYESDGSTRSKYPLILLVIARDNTNNYPVVTALNGSGPAHNLIPGIAANTKLTGAGRAATESQIRTQVYSALPSSNEFTLQKFCAETQVTEEWLMAKKRAQWTSADIDDEAIYRMLNEKEVSNWIGVQAPVSKIKTPGGNKAENLYTSQGIWWQTDNQFSFGGTVDIDMVIKLSKTIFTGNTASRKRLVLVGSDLLEAILQMDGYTSVVYLGERKTVWNIEVRELVTNFGTLLLALAPPLDGMTMGGVSMSTCGMWIDPAYLTEYTMTGGIKVKRFDLEASAQAMAQGAYFYDISALRLRYPQAHGRITLA